ncbi:hypothetical protein Dimus_019716 [Dionaea muscipula]
MAAVAAVVAAVSASVAAAVSAAMATMAAVSAAVAAVSAVAASVAAVAAAVSTAVAASVAAVVAAAVAAAVAIALSTTCSGHRCSKGGEIGQSQKRARERIVWKMTRRKSNGETPSVTDFYSRDGDGNYSSESPRKIGSTRKSKGNGKHYS